MTSVTPSRAMAAMTGSTEHAADAERLARLRQQRDDAPIRYSDGFALAPMVLFQWIDVDFLFQQLDAALRDAEALREEVGRLRETMDALEWLKEKYDAAPADTKSLRHPLTGDTEFEKGRLFGVERCAEWLDLWGKNMASSEDEARWCREMAAAFRNPDITFAKSVETRPAASGEDVERREICDEDRETAVRLVPPLFLGSAFKLVSPGNFAALEAKLSDDIAAALTAARLSGRAEMAKLDEPVIAAAYRWHQAEWEGWDSATIRKGRADFGEPLDDDDADMALIDAIVARNAALKALPE